MKTLRYGLLISFLAASSISFGQTAIVSWGGNYLTGNTDFARTAVAGSNFGNVGGTATNDSRRFLSFSESIALNPSAGYSGTSAVFYGGYTVARYDSGTSPQVQTLMRVTNNSSTDAISFRAEGPSAGNPSTGEAQGLVVWQNANFLNFSGNSNITFNSASQLSATLGTSTTGLSEVRWVVKDGSNYYVSQTSFTTSSSLTNPNSTQWALYDPTSGIKFSGSGFSSITMTNIQAVGLYWAANSISWTSATGGAPRIDIEAFSASAITAAIPEPSTYAAILGVVSLTGVLIRRRRQALEA